MVPARVACVRYLNTLPLVDGLEGVAGLEVVSTAPSRIAPMVGRGEADLGLGSIIDVARSATGLALLPVGMIGSDGPTMTVRVFSRVPMEAVSRVHADVESHTSTALCQIVLERLHGTRPEVVDFDARERIERTPSGAAERPTEEQAWPETMLLIGDKVVVDAPPDEEYPHQLDLGLAWRHLTGLPMVYAMWMCRAGEAGDRRVQLAADLLDRQRRRNATRLDWIVSRRACEHGWPLERARRYVGSMLRFEVGAREIEAVRVFLEEAARAGLAPRHEVRVAEPARPAV
jgi:chorismate dehydratase